MLDYRFIDRRFSVSEWVKWRWPGFLQRLGFWLNPFSVRNIGDYQLWAVTSMVEHYGKNKFEAEIAPRIEAELERRR